MLYPVELQPHEPKTARIILFFRKMRKGVVTIFGENMLYYPLPIKQP